jgi:hypothetical protein
VKLKVILFWLVLPLVFMFPFGAIWGGRVLEHKPSFCISCHEMKPSFDGWIASGVLSACPQHLFSLFPFLIFEFSLLFSFLI